MAIASSQEGSTKRVFVGNLFPDVTDQDISKLFSNFGAVKDIEMKTRKNIDGVVVSTFAFVNLEMDTAKLQSCIQKLNGLNWKKHTLKVQAAQESFMQRLQRERAERVKNFDFKPDPAYDPIKLIQTNNSNQVPVEDKKPIKHLKSKEPPPPEEKKPKVKKNTERERYEKFLQPKPNSNGDIGLKNKKDLEEEKEEITFEGPVTGKAVSGLVVFDDDEEVEDISPVQKRVRYHSSTDESEDDAQTLCKKPSSFVPLVPKSSKKLEEKRTKAIETKKPVSLVKERNDRINAQRYHTSSDEDDSDAQQKQKSSSSGETRSAIKSEETKKRSQAAKRYYSSSDEDEIEDQEQKKNSKVKGESIIKNLSTFNSSIWDDSDNDYYDSDREEREMVTKKSPADKKGSSKMKEKVEIKQNLPDPNLKRLDSIRTRQRDLKREKMLISSSLANVKIRFEDKRAEESKNEGAESGTTLRSSKLFEDHSSDEDEEEEEDKRFKIRDHFEGESGHKLLQLQSRIGSDDRFKLDHRFKDEKKSKKKKNLVDTVEDEDEVALKMEKAKNLEILESIVGEPATKRKRTGTLFKDSTNLRFDPDAEDHAKFELKEKSSTDDDNTSSEEEDQIEEEKKQEIEVKLDSSEPNYWLKTETFKKADDPGSSKSSFSFGFNFNNDTTTNKSELKSASTIADSDIKKKKLGFLESNPFKYDSSDDENDEREEKKFEKTFAPAKLSSTSKFERKLATKSQTLEKSSESFFFSIDDKRKSEALEFLGSTESADVTREKFEKQRPILANILKKKLRSKAKKKVNFGVPSARKNINKKFGKKNSWKTKPTRRHKK